MTRDEVMDMVLDCLTRLDDEAFDKEVQNFVENPGHYVLFSGNEILKLVDTIHNAIGKTENDH